MGGGSFDYNAYRAFSSTTIGKTTDKIYTSRGLHRDLDPDGVKVRESRDSDEHPASTPIIVALDVTGSMGILADVMAREGLGVLFQSILDRKPVTDPQVMFAGVGDVTCDRAPFRMSQFESDNRIVEQLTKIYLEHGGGGNFFESYNLPWYFAANHTVHDAFEKRGKRGYLFTIGDEPAPDDLTDDQIERVFGYTPQQVLSNKELLEQVQRFYDVYHIIVEEGQHIQQHGLDSVRRTWTPLLGQKALVLDDHKKMSELIVSVIEMAEGQTAETTAARWGGKTADTVLRSLKGLTPGKLGGVNRPRLGRSGA